MVGSRVAPYLDFTPGLCKPVDRMAETKTKILAYMNLVCPFCTMGRKYPGSFVGKKVRKHWEKGCPTHKAYQEVFGKPK